MSTMEERMLALIRGKPEFADDESLWVGQKQLGYGGQGCAALFVKRDSTTQKIIDRMVVKETWPTDATDWNDQYKFFGPKKEYPREHYMSMILPKGSTNTIDIMGSRLFPDKRYFKLFMEYCPGGDLKELFRSYKKRSLVFPEPYLWKIFQDLAQAAHAMNNPSGDGLVGDEAIAHIDFKLSNIFLCLPDEDNFPKYPIAKLADFGGAIICSPRDSEEIHKKKWESISFSPGYVAPDVERFWQNTAADVIPARDTKPGITSGDIPKRITTATNIWNVGMIMADLMSPHRFRRPNWNHLAYSARETWLDNFINQIDTDPSMKDYSKLLKDTVIQCVNYIPDQRPTPTDLLARVGHGVDLHCGHTQTRKCLDTTTYNGRYDLDLSAPFSEDYPITQPDDWIMADNDDDVFASAEPPGAGGPLPAKPQAEARQSKTTKAGAPQDTPHKEFLVGPNAGESTRNFFDDVSGYETVEKPAPPHGFLSALRQALMDDMMD